MAKNDKPSVDKIVKKVNKEFEKTSRQIEGLVNDALKQFDSLQNQVQEPILRLLKEAEELREREMKRIHDEFERRLGDFHELQDAVMERLGLASKEAEKKAGELADKAADQVSGTGGKTSTKGSASKKASGAKKTSGTASKGTAKKAPAAKKPAAKKPAANKPAASKSAATRNKPAAKATDKSDLTRVKGIGPATAKKMKDAGITSVQQIANPSAADKEKLKAFSGLKGFSTLGDEAKKVL